ncbi:MAG: WD40/YVTN/BNR-like repeat-containing protein [Pseudomonas sp.]
MLDCIGMIRSRCGLATFVLASLLAVAPLAQAFQPPLETTAPRSDRLVSGPLLTVTTAGSRLVAAGLRGGIIVSDDHGKSWVQAQVPVSVDLVSIVFPSAQQGWAVGHGGVVLHSADGGLTWQKQLDGLQAREVAIDFYTRNPEGIEDAASFLAKEQSQAVDKETQPFLDVFFSDDQHGYVVGTFNRIFVTADGGKSWVPQMHLTNNPQEWHIYSVTGAAGQVYLTGEQGRVWRLAPQSKHFESVDTPYNGTLFGVTLGADGAVYAYGMRGSLFRSSEQGQSWQRIDLASSSNVTRVLSLGHDSLLVVAQNGEVSRSDDAGRSFKALPLLSPMPYFGAALVGESSLALVGVQGVRVEAI